MEHYRIRRSWEYSPLLIFWEATKACMLKCKHCRAEAIKEPLPGELQYDEALDLIDQVSSFDDPKPILIVTGGDPLMRKDIWDVLRYAVSKKLRVALAPSVSPLLTRDSIRKLVETGIKGISISIDSPYPDTHDKIRGVPGTWYKTIKLLNVLVETGIHVQVNTVIMRETVEGLADMAKLLLDVGIRVWEPFYLVPVGRAWTKMDLDPNEWEDVSHFLYEVTKYGLTVRTVEGPMFRRVSLLRMMLENNGINPDSILKTSTLYRKLIERLKNLMNRECGEPRAQTTGTRDGKGIIFIAYNGDIYPSGFLPLLIDNIRKKRLKEVYRNNPVLRRLRLSNFDGKCGRCEFRDVCGGSRARAYSYYGNPFAEDPACPYRPGELKLIAKKIGIDENEVKRFLEKLSRGKILD